MYGEPDKLAKAKEYKHMTFSEAASLAKEAQPKEMWLTHYSPSLAHPEEYIEETRKIFQEQLQQRTEEVFHWILSRKKVRSKMEEKNIKILAIESSCDETAAAVVENGRKVLSNVISTQIDIHTLYGGVVPEIASRKHLERINQVVKEALKQASVTLEDIDAVAVTYGPGLVGALLVGTAEAKAIAYAAGKPLVGVHHIEGHIAANYIENQDLEPPFMCLIVSGGHTHLVVVEDYDKFNIIGRTRDDAAGEAFDKVARSIGLGYPGGPKIDKAAKLGNPDAITFPKAKMSDNPYDLASVV